MKLDLSKISWITIGGSIVFVILYFIATLYYPEFSWVKNYWCNLLNEHAINGKPNGARSIAISAMIVLCISLSVFWITVPVQMNLNRSFRLIIQGSGLLAMIAGIFLFTTFDHDTITNLASFFGLIATIGCLIALYQKKWTKLLVFGLMNMLLVVINNLLYYNPDWIVYLPVVQKITFLSFLWWVCDVSITSQKSYNKNLPGN